MKMKLTMIACLMVLAIVAAGCTEQTNQAGNETEQRFCTEDAKICPDGSSVGRDPENNCEFRQCPAGGSTGELSRRYVSDNTTVCAATLFTCIEGSSPFFDDTGCGCESKEPKRYVSQSLEQCATLRYTCEEGEQAFTDDLGCGCEFSWEGLDLPGIPKLQATECTDPRPEACTREYNPVCGQVQVECIRAPCPAVKQTFGNKCEACANDRTISYTEGACEDPNLAGGTVPAGPNAEQCTNIGGTWTGYDCEGISQGQCQEIGGEFDECASACRNDPDAEICTMQCVQVCTLP